MNIDLDLSNGFDTGLNKRRISRRKEYVDASSEPQSQNLIDCPVTGEPAKKLVEIFVDIPNGQANWWCCSACKGWHLNLEDKHNGSQK